MLPQQIDALKIFLRVVLRPVHTRELAPETRFRVSTQPVHTKDTTRQLNDETTQLGHGNYESEFAMSCE